MSLEITLIRVMRTRDSFSKLYRGVRQEVLEDMTRIVLRNFDRYYREFPDVKEIEFDPFWSWWKQTVMPGANTTVLDNFAAVLRPMEEPVPEAIRGGIMDRLVAAGAAYDMAKALQRFEDGDEIDLLSETRAIMEKFELDIERKVKTPWVQADIDDLLGELAEHKGLHWRLDCLNASLRPLMAGDFMIVAARPDVGKTTFFTDQLTHMSAQVDDLHPGEDRTILWFNNEGLGKRIVTRLYQSALDEPISGLKKRQQAGTLKADYAKAVGRADILRVMDIHDFWNHEVEDVIRANRPALIVFDMIDNIRFGGDINNNGQRTDQLLEAMYQWARILSVKHDCPVLATSQVSADGEGMQYPLLGMLKDSKTGKQGAADVILTIGYQAQFENARFLGTTKNKMAREGGPKNPKAEVVFDGLRGRYRDLVNPLPFQPTEAPEPE